MEREKNTLEEGEGGRLLYFLFLCCERQREGWCAPAFFPYELLPPFPFSPSLPLKTKLPLSARIKLEGP